MGAPKPTWRELDDELMLTSFIVADSYEAALKEAGDVILSKVKDFQQRGIGRCRIFTLMDEPFIHLFHNGGQI